MRKLKELFDQFKSQLLETGEISQEDLDYFFNQFSKFSKRKLKDIYVQVSKGGKHAERAGLFLERAHNASIVILKTTLPKDPVASEPAGSIDTKKEEPTNQPKKLVWIWRGDFFAICISC